MREVKYTVDSTCMDCGGSSFHYPDCPRIKLFHTPQDIQSQLGATPIIFSIPLERDMQHPPTTEREYFDSMDAEPD